MMDKIFEGFLSHQYEEGMALAAARRTFRDPVLGPLEPIGSLHYFLPVIRELQRQPIDPEYLHHIETRLAEYRSEAEPHDHRSA